MEEKKQALLDHLELYPSSGLRFIEQDVLAYLADEQRVSTRLRLVIQVGGNCFLFLALPGRWGADGWLLWE